MKLTNSRPCCWVIIQILCKVSKNFSGFQVTSLHGFLNCFIGLLLHKIFYEVIFMIMLPLVAGDEVFLVVHGDPNVTAGPALEVTFLPAP